MADSNDSQLDLSAPRAGRPFKFTDPKLLAVRIQSYFDNCDPHVVKKVKESGYNDRGETIWLEREVMTKQIPYGIVDLALHLGVSRQTLLNYQKPEHYTDEIPEDVRQALMDTIETAIQRVEGYNERQLHVSGLANGVKFNLSNNFKGWEDKKVVDNNNRTVGEDLDALDDDVVDQQGKVSDAAAAAIADDRPAQTEDQPAPDNPDDGSTPQE